MLYTKRHLSATLGDTQGSVSIMFAFVVSLMFMALTISVDFVRATAVSQKVAFALDAAALAGAKLFDADGKTDADIKQRATDYFNSELGRIGDKNASFDAMVPHVDRSAKTVTASVRGHVNTYFGKVAGIPTIPVSKSATVTYKMRKIEVSMALDVTGSMLEIPAGDTRTKIESLQQSAKNLIDSVLSKASNDNSVRIAISPYSASINPGSLTDKVTNSAASTGCVVERTGATSTTDAAATAMDTFPLVPTGNACPLDAVMPLRGRSSISDLKTSIDNFSPAGNTAGHLGTAWAWYMISPGWKHIVGGSHEPEPYSNEVIKSVVVMTDGLFNTAYVSGYPPGSIEASTESYTEFLALCTGMKAKGIEIYTVLFGLADPTAEARMKSCASSTTNYFSASNGAQLATSFAKIADRLNNMRISK
jgi:Flp pilus assembly protein TadG